VYLLLLTTGVVLTVPAIMRALDGITEPPIATAVGFTTLMAGMAGLLLIQFGLGGVITFIAALALGLAAGALHPELLDGLRRRNTVES
jgi:Na+(H+)/acetate symporter ActP